jgi:protein arginine phosphatase
MRQHELVTGSILFLCTGNAARSVMAGVALRHLRPDLRVETAGTLSVDGMPISWRTRAALDAVGLEWPQHASRQAHATDLAGADLVVALAPEHVDWVRREHPTLAARTATLVRLARDLPHGRRSLSDRLAVLGPHDVQLAAWEEVVDPGGGEVEAFVACARQIVELIDQLAPKL